MIKSTKDRLKKLVRIKSKFKKKFKMTIFFGKRMSAKKKKKKKKGCFLFYPLQGNLHCYSFSKKLICCTNNYISSLFKVIVCF